MEHREHRKTHEFCFVMAPAHSLHQACLEQWMDVKMESASQKFKKVQEHWSLISDAESFHSFSCWVKRKTSPFWRPFWIPKIMLIIFWGAFRPFLSFQGSRTGPADGRRTADFPPEVPDLPGSVAASAMRATCLTEAKSRHCFWARDEQWSKDAIFRGSAT